MTFFLLPFGFLCIALFGVGWGKPVMIDDRNFKNRAKGTMLTALAGPVSNLLLALLFTIVLKFNNSNYLVHFDE